MSDTVKEESMMTNGKKTRRGRERETCGEQEFLLRFLFLLLCDLQRKVRKWVTRRTNEMKKSETNGLQNIFCLVFFFETTFI